MHFEQIELNESAISFVLRLAFNVGKPSHSAILNTFLPDHRTSVFGESRKMIKSRWLAACLLFAPWFAQGPFVQAQTVTSFEGIDASQLGHPEFDVDPNGAVGTKQYLEWTNPYFQAFDKTNRAQVWSAPVSAATIWRQEGISNCNIAGDGLVLFDRLASRWIVAGHNSPGINGPYFYCIAVSNTDDLSSPSLAWYAYEFQLPTGVNASGHPYFPDWPKLGTWADGYYLSFDLMDPNQGYRIIGIEACALDRTNIVTGGLPNPIQCFSDPSPIPTSGEPYLGHSLIPADVEGNTAPPAGRPEFFTAVQNPPRDGKTTTSNTINLWAFHVDWSDPANSTFTKTPLDVTSYTPGCYRANAPGNTVCVVEPSLNSAGKHYLLDSVGDRLMPRLAYRNFGTYESFLVSHTIRVGLKNPQTAVRWYELRDNGAGTPEVYQSGNINPSGSVYRFMPSLAQDQAGNVAVGYSVSSGTVHPGIRAASWSLLNQTAPHEINIQTGVGDSEDSVRWGDYTSMTVDPVDECTFWYVNEYLKANQVNGAITWDSRIAHFSISGCSSHKTVQAPLPEYPILVASPVRRINPD